MTLYYRPDYISAMIHSTLHLCANLLNICNGEENQVKLLQSAFSCALCTIEKACTLCNGEDGAIHDKAITKIRKLLKEWIADKRVIGGSDFGYNIMPSYITSRRMHSHWKGKEELKVNHPVCTITKFYHNSSLTATV